MTLTLDSPVERTHFGINANDPYTGRVWEIMYPTVSMARDTEYYQEAVINSRPVVQALTRTKSLKEPDTGFLMDAVKELVRVGIIENPAVNGFWPFMDKIFPKHVVLLTAILDCYADELGMPRMDDARGRHFALAFWDDIESLYQIELQKRGLFLTWQEARSANKPDSKAAKKKAAQKARRQNHK